MGPAPTPRASLSRPSVRACIPCRPPTTSEPCCRPLHGCRTPAVRENRGNPSGRTDWDGATMQQHRRVKGFPEWTPAVRLIEQTLIARVQRVYEDWGFRGIETRSVEPVEVLLAKGETDQEIFAV